jgi:signal recognition particle subunit SRP54
VFENLTNKFQDIFRKLTGKGKLSEADVDQALKEVRMALLSADVHVSVVKAFSERVRVKAVSQEILASLTPGQQVIRVVRDEMAEILGTDQTSFNLPMPTAWMIVGLQGSGKTTTCAKLAHLYQKRGKHVLLVGLDLKRPAALDQLRYLAEQEKVACFAQPGNSVHDVLSQAKSLFEAKQYDLAILDTAGRLHIDEFLMGELVEVKKVFQPKETTLVLDATTGHVAVGVGQEFQRWVDYDSVILSKMDGDARGGAALSCKFVTGKPIRFVGVGEKIEDLETFYPDRMAQRILGMGDVLTLIDRAEKAFSLEEREKLEKRLLKEKFDLGDFLEQMQGLGRMGSLDGLLPSVPGMPNLQGAQLDTKQLKRWEAIILSMTREERLYPEIINSSRKKRIAKGSGTSVQDVNILLKRFDQFKQMTKQVKRGVLPRFAKF